MTEDHDDAIVYTVAKAAFYRIFLAILPTPFGGALWCGAPETNGTGGQSEPRKKILIVEDNEINLKLLNDLLEFQGYQISTTAYGLDAIAIARGTRPDLILLDIQLPDVSGFEVAGRLKADAATRATPIIAVTAFAMQGDEQKALASGCDAYIAKPINVRDFLHTVATFLGTQELKD